MMKKHFIAYLSAVALLLCSMLFSCKPQDNPSDGQGSIYGTITDKSTGDCVPIAGVELMPKGLRTVTGSDGTFQFTEIDPGQYNLFITKVGYQDYKSNTITVKSGETAKGDVQIERVPASLQIVDNSGNAISLVDFGSDEGVTSKTFNIFNGGVETLNYTITKTANWIETISQSTGSINVGVTFPVIITINRELLSEGVNSTTLLITSPSSGGIELIVKATKGSPHTGSCTVVFDLFDKVGDGWNGAGLGISDGTSTYQLTIENGNIANYSFDFPVGTNISVVFSGGSYDSECSYRIYYKDGDVIFEKTAGTITTGLQYTFIVDCENTGNGGGNNGGGSDELIERFESGIPLSWETIDSDGDGYCFIQNADWTGHTGKCVSSASYINDIGVVYPDNYLVTPLVSISNNSVLSFWACAQDSEFPTEHFGVAISTTSQTNASSFTTIKEWTLQSKNATNENETKHRGNRDQGSWHQYSVSLSSYAGRNVYIAIRHFNCDDQFYLNIDDVVLNSGR